MQIVFAVQCVIVCKDDLIQIFKEWKHCLETISL